MARKRKNPEEHAATLAYLKCFANRPVSMMELQPLYAAAKLAFLSGKDPVQAMIAYADANGIEHNEVA